MSLQKLPLQLIEFTMLSEDSTKLCPTYPSRSQNYLEVERQNPDRDRFFCKKERQSKTGAGLLL